MEARFRAKRKDNKEWVYGYYYKFKGSHNCKVVYTYSIMDENGESFEVMPGTIGQCIGIKDKNKKEPYVWDILKYTMAKASDTEDRKEVIDFIAYDKGAFRLWNFKALHHYFDDEPLRIFDVEVLGNVFDNMDILDEHQQEQAKVLLKYS